MPDELELFKITYEKWKDHDIWFLLIGRLDQEEGLGVISSDRLTIFNLERNIDRLNVYSVFGLRSQDSYFYVFDSAGRKVVASRSVLGYERGPKTFLNELLTGTRFSIEELMERNHNIGEYEWFRSIDKIITSNREYEYFVFSLLTKICDSCAGAEIVQFMKRIRLITPQGVYVASFLGREFSESDITNLKSQLNINYPIFIADNELRWKWDELIDKYN